MQNGAEALAPESASISDEDQALMHATGEKVIDLIHGALGDEKIELAPMLLGSLLGSVARALEEDGGSPAAHYLRQGAAVAYGVVTGELLKPEEE